MENHHQSNATEQKATQEHNNNQTPTNNHASEQPRGRNNKGTDMDTTTDLLDYAATKNAAMTLRAINHKLRQQIIKLLEDNQRMNVTDIYVKLRLEQSVASQHLAILRRANIVKTVREGKFIHYALNNDRIAAVSKFVKEMTGEETKANSNQTAPAEAEAATA